MIGAPPWIDPKEALRYKEMYRDLSHSVNAIATSLTGLKFDITAIALGLTLVKADFTLLKVDEKGVTLRGKQIATFRWADQKKHLENRIERAERKGEKDRKKLADDVKELERVKKLVAEKSQAAKNSKDKTFVYETRAELSKLMRDAERIEKRIREKVSKLSRSNSLQVKLDRIKESEKEAEKSRKKVAEDARKTRAEMNALLREMRSVQSGLRSFSNAL